MLLTGLFLPHEEGMILDKLKDHLQKIHNFVFYPLETANSSV